MSTVIPFKNHCLRFNGNMLGCITLERKCRLSYTVAVKPWAAALQRLLRERPGLEKGALARLCPDRDGSWSESKTAPKHLPIGRISDLLNPNRGAPHVATLQRLVEGFNRWNRLNPEANLAEVQLWEFFVTDEQSTVLRNREAALREFAELQTLERRAEERLMAKLAPQVKKAVREAVRQTARVKPR